jgi:hypothetical protein
MPALILSPRYSDDSIKLRRAAVALGWDVMRVAGWRCPDDFAPEEPVLYAEPLFNAVVAEQLGLTVEEPFEDFLAGLPQKYVSREIRLTAASEARALRSPVFLKPSNRKTFPAMVYGSGAELPDMPNDDPVLASESVEWAAEFRFFLRSGSRTRSGRSVWGPTWRMLPKASAPVRHNRPSHPRVDTATMCPGRTLTRHGTVSPRPVGSET